MTVQQQWTSRPIQSFDGDHRGRHEDRFPLLLSNWYYYRSLRSLHFGHSATFFEGLYTVFVPPGPADLPVDQRFAAVADPRQTRRKSGAWRQGRGSKAGAANAKVAGRAVLCERVMRPLAGAVTATRALHHVWTLIRPVIARY